MRLDQLDELVAVLADNDGPEVAGGVVPHDAVVVLVVEHGQAGLVVELLEALDRDPDVVGRVDGAFLLALPVVGLRNTEPGDDKQVGVKKKLEFRFCVPSLGFLKDIQKICQIIQF